MKELTNKEFKFVCELIWGGVSVDRKWAEETAIFKEKAPKILGNVSIVRLFIL